LLDPGPKKARQESVDSGLQNARQESVDSELKKARWESDESGPKQARQESVDSVPNKARQERVTDPAARQGRARNRLWQGVTDPAARQGRARNRWRQGSPTRRGTARQSKESLVAGGRGPGGAQQGIVAGDDAEAEWLPDQMVKGRNAVKVEDEDASTTVNRPLRLATRNPVSAVSDRGSLIW
jgi:hypothetical protein